MPNLPPHLAPPDNAVAIVKDLKLTTRATEDESGMPEAVEAQVLAIGWRSDHERLYYLVFDAGHGEIFWVDPEFVDSLTG